jgi:tryptophanyl-tRNA synthetase
MSDETQKIVFSGVQPSGTLHIGNYLGAIKQWVSLQDTHKAYYCIVDEHAITVPYEPKDLPERIMDVAALYISCGLDPDKSTIFVQSHIGAHTELAWLLSTITPFGDMSRMTQFKDKAKKQQINTSLGLFAYPVLMAADILLYQTNIVPVGEDQTQHIELTRSLAERFNNRFGETFAIPEALINKQTARIMSLSDPAKKMSKSDSPKSYISLTDNAETIVRKIGTAVTETEPVISFTKSGPAVKNLLAIYQAFSQEEPATIEASFSGKGYKQFKEELAQLIIEHLEPIQRRYHELRADDSDLRIILGRGAEHARHAANYTLNTVKEKMGLR